ncbi:MAG: collagen-like triple helix repeat-containing protein [Solirubrobacterales bacterium]
MADRSLEEGVANYLASANYLRGGHVLSKLRSQLTYANVMVTALMFVVLGGGAYAAFRLPANSVKSRHIAPDAAQGVDINEASLDTSVLQSRVGGVCQEGQAIQSVLASGQVTCETALQGQPGTPGTPGAPGAPGQPGADGTSFIWQGPWEAGREYAPNDVVSHQGSSWIATKGEACEPGSVGCAQWDLLAQKGEQGVPGEPGAAGTPGSAGASALTGLAESGGAFSGTMFAAPNGTSSMNANESAVQHLSPNSSIVARDLAVKTTASSGVQSGNLTFTLMDDSTATSFSCAVFVPPGSGFNTPYTCNSGAATATISPASELSLRMATPSSGVFITAPVQFGYRATMP